MTQPVDEEVLASWADELDRRSREVESGEVETVDWASAQADILRELETIRRSRA